MRTAILYPSFLLVAMMCVVSCRKKSNSTSATELNASKYISKMAGRRLFSGHYSHKYPPDTSVQTTDVIDTPYLIEQISNNSINAFGEVLNCFSVDDSSMIATFNYSEDGWFSTAAQLTYYFVNDSIVYGSYGTHHEYWISTSLHTD